MSQCTATPSGAFSNSEVRASRSSCWPCGSLPQPVIITVTVISCKKHFRIHFRELRMGNKKMDVRRVLSFFRAGEQGSKVEPAEVIGNGAAGADEIRVW